MKLTNDAMPLETIGGLAVIYVRQEMSSDVLKMFLLEARIIKTSFFYALRIHLLVASESISTFTTFKVSLLPSFRRSIFSNIIIRFQQGMILIQSQTASWSQNSDRFISTCRKQSELEGRGGFLQECNFDL